MNKMGFFAMIMSFILGIFFTILGASRRKRNVLYKFLIVLGIILILFAVYLASPK
jgi:ABC-type dipeptide/oligopeptide/nickel transport system permease component